MDERLPLPQKSGEYPKTDQDMSDAPPSAAKGTPQVTDQGCWMHCLEYPDCQHASCKMFYTRREVQNEAITMAQNISYDIERRNHLLRDERIGQLVRRIRDAITNF